MRRVLLTLLLSLICCGVWAQQRGPRMTFDTSTHNFGDVKRQGGDLIKEFRFTNDGDAPLIIKKITKSCSCMTITYSRKPVIKIKYEPHKAEPGIFHKAVQIYSNEPSSKLRLITIQGNSIDETK